MSKDVKNPSKMMDLEERIETLEAEVRVLLHRTAGLVRIGAK